MSRAALLFCSVIMIAAAGCSGKSPSTEPSGPAKVLESPSPTGSMTVGSDASKTAGMTYKDVLERIRSKGLTVHMASARSGQVYLIDGTQDGVEREVNLLNDGVLTKNIVVCVKHDNEKAAKEYVGASEGGRFQWGVFSFRSSSEGHQELNRLRKALE